MITLDIQEIQKILPHRYPMLLVDRVVELEPMETGCGYQEYHLQRTAVHGPLPG